MVKTDNGTDLPDTGDLTEVGNVDSFHSPSRMGFALKASEKSDVQFSRADELESKANRVTRRPPCVIPKSAGAVSLPEIGDLPITHDVGVQVSSPKQHKMFRSGSVV